MEMSLCRSAMAEGSTLSTFQARLVMPSPYRQRIGGDR